MTYSRHFGHLSDLDRNQLRFSYWSEDKWALGTLVGLFLLAGIAMYAFSSGDHQITAMAPADETTGQITRPSLPSLPQ